MTEKTENPPLFMPSIHDGRMQMNPWSDLTLLDLFAAFALAGCLSNPGFVGGKLGLAQDVAEACYHQAEAMLAERQRRAKEGK